MVHPSFTDRSNPDWDESREIYEYAREAMDEGHYLEAIELFQKSIHMTPNNKALFLLGECLMKEKRLNEAVVAYAAATTMNRSGIAPAHLAEVWFELGEVSNAMEMIELALKRQPHYKRAQKSHEEISVAYRKHQQRFES